MNFGKWRNDLLRLLPVCIVALLAILPQPSLAANGTGDVYVLTNQSTGNSIMLFERDAVGSLTLLATYASGGNGTGTGADPLGSQHSLVLSPDEQLLFAVNAGSNSVSVFAVFGNQLKLLHTVSSNGVMPVSLAVGDSFVYVLNAGGTPNVSGFRIDSQTANLIPLPGSTQNLPGGAGSKPAQVSFRPGNGALVVTEQGSNAIDTFPLVAGVAQAGMSVPSSGTGPFGFAFGLHHVAVVSNAAGGASGGSSVATYQVAEHGVVKLITPALGDTQTAACWLVITGDGKYAYTANTGSGTISSYTISGDGSLALLSATAATLASGGIPVDMALTDDSQFLYARDAGNGSVAGFGVAADGSLTPLASVPGVPSGAQGVAAR